MVITYQYIGRQVKRAKPEAGAILVVLGAYIKIYKKKTTVLNLVIIIMII